jgi:hypothetical protein
VLRAREADVSDSDDGSGPDAQPLPAFLADEEDESAADPEDPEPHVIAAE